MKKTITLKNVINGKFIFFLLRLNVIINMIYKYMVTQS